MHIEQKKLEEKNHELAERFREKAKNQAQLQRLYTSLKQQQVAHGMELAAEHDADNVLHAVASNNRGGQPLHSRAGSNNSGGSGNRRQNLQGWDSHGQGNRHGLQSSRKWYRPNS